MKGGVPFRNTILGYDRRTRMTKDAAESWPGFVKTRGVKMEVLPNSSVHSGRGSGSLISVVDVPLGICRMFSTS